jgi:hypothetical protein
MKVSTMAEPTAGSNRGKVILTRRWKRDRPHMAPASSSSESMVMSAPDIRRKA